MPRRRHSIASTAEVITITEPVAMEELEDKTVEDYRKLNEKCDQIMSKKKDRKKKK